MTLVLPTHKQVALLTKKVTMHSEPGWATSMKCACYVTAPVVIMRLGQVKRTMCLPSTRQAVYARATRTTQLSHCTWNICEGKGPHFPPSCQSAHKIFWMSLSAVTTAPFCNSSFGFFSVLCQAQLHLRDKKQEWHKFPPVLHAYTIVQVRHCDHFSH